METDSWFVRLHGKVGEISGILYFLFELLFLGGLECFNRNIINNCNYILNFSQISVDSSGFPNLPIYHTVS